MRKSRGFTLIELMIGMTIFALIMTTVLVSVENMSIARIKTENRITLLEELYFFSEQLITNIKEGGTLDYEEYYNRKNYDTQIASGHYLLPSGVGNYGRGGDLGSTYGAGLYYCVSQDNSNRVGTGGCLSSLNTSSINGGASQNYAGTYQRYGEYALQFFDYNGNADSDGGDEDGVDGIIGDEDDKEIGDAPGVLSGSTPELYLINPDENTRTFFRLTLKNDPNDPTGAQCVMSGANMGDNCLGNIQILKMRGYDLGENHTGSLAGNFGAFDGNIDTWVCHPDWRCAGPTIAGAAEANLATGKESEWVDMFPDFINVKSVRFIAYPQKNPWLSWAAKDDTITPGFVSPFIHPYIRLELTLGFAWGKRRTIKNDNPTISINTSVSLRDF